jgi:hypothetical protein
MSELTSWLDGLKAGDEVAVCHTGSFQAWYDFRRVEKRTPTQITVGATRYRVKDGRECGDCYRSHLEEATPELKQQEAEKKKQQHLAVKLEAVRWRNLPLSTLQAVDAVMEQSAHAERR